MNPIDYWYKKYIALKECERIPKPELTWEDIWTLGNIVDKVKNDFCDNPNIFKLINVTPENLKRAFGEEVLRRFNELKEKHNGM